MNLTERRKADRVLMLAGVVALLTRLRVEFRETTKELARICPRRVAVELILPRGLRLTVDFDGDSPQPDCFVLSWHVALGSSACLSAEVFDSINNYHYQKATDIARGYERLLQVLESRVLAVGEGLAFSEANEADYRKRREEGRLPGKAVST